MVGWIILYRFIVNFTFAGGEAEEDDEQAADEIFLEIDFPFGIIGHEKDEQDQNKNDRLGPNDARQQEEEENASGRRRNLAPR
jgi:hypothetical protein